MKKASLILWIMLLLVACHRSTDATTQVVPADTMVAFLTEAHLVESYYAVESNYRYDSIYPQLFETYDSLFLKYGFSRERFDSSMVYYNDHADQLIAIFEQVEKNLLCIIEQSS